MLHCLNLSCTVLIVACPPYAAHCCPLVLVAVLPPQLQLNTFQVVLATDGQRSLAVFNYAEDGINWAGGDAFSAVSGAVAGYNVGDDDRYFKFPESLSEDIQHIDNITGNTGRRGQWVFLLDGEFNMHLHDY